jgi:hypothetical protein
VNYLGNIIDRPDALAAFLGQHDTAIALAIIFAFAGAVFFAPTVTK